METRMPPAHPLTLLYSEHHAAIFGTRVERVPTTLRCCVPRRGERGDGAANPRRRRGDETLIENSCGRLANVIAWKRFETRYLVSYRRTR